MSKTIQFVFYTIKAIHKKREETRKRFESIFQRNREKTFRH